MTPYTTTPGVTAVCRCKAKAGLKRSPRSSHTRHDCHHCLNCESDSSFKMTCCSIPSSVTPFKRRSWWVIVIGSTRNGSRETRCPSAQAPSNCSGRHRCP
ncbi:hypothetical protein TNCV_1851211 [Trichonephila clavipes]|nr:hypothetical protein TNCV_1851211 [Trichonephila clavipes]